MTDREMRELTIDELIELAPDEDFPHMNDRELAVLIRFARAVERAAYEKQKGEFDRINREAAEKASKAV